MSRRSSLGALAALLAASLLAGCGQNAPPSVQPPPASMGAAQPGPAVVGAPQPAAPATPAPIPPAGDVTGQPPAPPPALTSALTPQEKYEAALTDALGLLADGKLTEALAALEAGRAAQDTEQIRLEIDKLKLRIERQAAADRTVQDIQAVLSDGKPDEAARLAGSALLQFGGTTVAARLGTLKRQADALLVVQIDDQAARRTRFRAEADAALKEKNLRAAAIALEQTLQYGEDADASRQLDEVRAALSRYDDNRQRAAELRKDPASLEDALALLQEAAKAWDTLQVRAEIDEYTLALQKRRDRLSVADFEVRGEVGIPEAGRTIAEELLPAFKLRFDLMERGQLGKVIEELKLEASSLAQNEDGRREVGRLAKVRYLVLGSVTRLSGLVVNARLVDVRSGLVVQTAKIVAPTPEDLMAQLPQLANLLTMTDEQRVAWEQRQAQQAQAPVQPVAAAAVPPAPEPPVAETPA
jgi:hypothetical protein